MLTHSEVHALVAWARRMTFEEVVFLSICTAAVVIAFSALIQ